ncbi:MAG: DNA repair protein RecN [Geminicoccaceae bacterium]|nr:DNA repair protein RecN [Geminicoccaceae bacterium]
MLRSLAIRDIVLIERLDLEFNRGLTVLTGETGAGKSIILDGLGLALGGRADRGLVRGGAAQGSVTAAFEVPEGHPALAILEGQGLPADGDLVLRRVVTADGRGRAYLNGEPVSASALRRVGDALVEVHGQMDQRGLQDPRTHGALLDALGGHGPRVAATAAAFARWRGLARAFEARRDEVAKARAEEDYLRHRLAELEDLAPEAGEEERLAGLRARLVHREKTAEALAEVARGVSGGGGALALVAAAQRRLERGVDVEGAGLGTLAAALDRALIELGEVEEALAEAERGLDDREASLEAVEDRLFALRDAARKHRVPVAELPALAEATRAAIAGIDAGSDRLCYAGREAEAARLAYLEEARRLSGLRAKAAVGMAASVRAELRPLKLERAALRVRLDPLSEDAAGAGGLERVAFEIQTNPGQPFGPLAKVASGGELSRLMLAMKVVLARIEAAPTLIFDEVDAGVGGATAAAVGERLARLASERQVLVVTHAPQIAARARDHLSVVKAVRDETTTVEVRRLPPAQRRDEIARMLAGAEVTDAARAAAASLMAAGET